MPVKTTEGIHKVPLYLFGIRGRCGVIGISHGTSPIDELKLISLDILSILVDGERYSFESRVERVKLHPLP